MVKRIETGYLCKQIYFLDNSALTNVVRDKPNPIISERELTILSNKKLMESIDYTALGISSDSESKKFKDIFLKKIYIIERRVTNICSLIILLKDHLTVQLT